MSEVKVNEYKTPATKAKRKNPILRTPQMNLPPSSRSRVSHGLTAAAALGLFELQTCRECGTVQYPPREGCGNCLSSRLFWKVQSGAGELLSTTNLEHSNDLYFKERLPWRLGFIKLDVGPSVVAFLTDAVGDAPTKVNLNLRLDRAGQAVFVADPAPYESGKDMNPNDKLVQETGCDPRGRKILVTDGKTPLGQSLVKSLLAAGADTVWVGHAEPWKKYPGFVELSKVPGVALVKLDLTDVKSVDEIAGEIGGKVDIVINNAEVHRAHSISSRRGTDVAMAEMEINYFGLLRLAQAFGPSLKGRAADGLTHAVAWVNVLSVFALSNFPAQGTFSASKAAALSLAQCLRAEMMPFGIRVLNVFPGPVDDEWNQNVPPPKVAPSALAAAIVKGLVSGVEDLYPGDIAQEWLARLRENPKALEREVARGQM